MQIFKLNNTQMKSWGIQKGLILEAGKIVASVMAVLCLSFSQGALAEEFSYIKAESTITVAQNEKEEDSKQVIRRRRPQAKSTENAYTKFPQKKATQTKRFQPKKKEKPMANISKGIKKSAITEKMKLEVVDQPIANLFRMISKTYKINIVPEDLGDIRVTMNLENISVTEGLNVICLVNGLEMNQVGDVIYIRKASEKAIAEMNLYSKRIDIQVENKPVKEFIKEFAEMTKISIVPEQDLEGKVTGHLKNVLPIDGFKALMAANNFQVRSKSGIYMVEKGEEVENLSKRRRIRRSSVANSGPLDVDVANGKVNASFRGANLGDAIRAITDLAEMNMVTYGNLGGEVDAEFKDVPLHTALSVLLQGTKYTFVIKEGMVLIGERSPKTPSGEVLSIVELHHLKYIRSDNAYDLLPKNLKELTSRVDEQNALLIMGTAESIKRVKEFLEQIDLPVPQVMIEVLVVEYQRSNATQFGLKIPGEGELESAGPKAGAHVEIPGVNMGFKQGSFYGAIKFLPQNWDIMLRATLDKKNGKVLSMPKITTLNGNKAHLRVKTTRYHPITQFNPQGMPATDFRAIDDGITIDLKPFVTRHGDVNLEISPSIKNALASGEGSRPADVMDRSISTNVRLMDGETLILGGLIDNQENKERRFIPILGSIPLLGYLFSWKSKSISTKELVIFVTPHILPPEGSHVNLEEELEGLDSRGGWVKDKYFSKPKDPELQLPKTSGEGAIKAPDKEGMEKKSSPNQVPSEESQLKQRP